MGILSPLTPRLVEYTNNEQLPIELKGKVLSTFPVKTKCKNCLSPKQWVTQINKYNERWAYFHRWLSGLLSITLQESFQSSCILTKEKKKKGLPNDAPAAIASGFSFVQTALGLWPSSPYTRHWKLSPPGLPIPQALVILWGVFELHPPIALATPSALQKASCQILSKSSLLFTKFRKITAFIPPGKVNSIPHFALQVPRKEIQPRARTHTHTHVHAYTPCPFLISNPDSSTQTTKVRSLHPTPSKTHNNYRGLLALGKFEVYMGQWKPLFPGLLRRFADLIATFLVAHYRNHP